MHSVYTCIQYILVYTRIRVYMYTLALSRGPLSDAELEAVSSPRSVRRRVSGAERASTGLSMNE